MIESSINIAGKDLAFSGYKTISTESAKNMGVVRTEKGEKPGNSFKFAKNINNFINKVAVERKTGPTVNVFWLKDNAEKDTIFVQVPLIPNGVQGEIPSLAIALQTDPKTREIIIQLLTVPGTTQEALKEYIQALLVPSGTKIDIEKINSSKIASLSSSGNALALTSTKRGTIPFSEELAKPFKSQIKIDSLDHQKEEVYELGGAQTSTPLMPEMVKKTISAPETKSTTIKEKIQLKEVKTEDENRLQEIDKLTTDRHILGKFMGEVAIHGVQVSKPDFNLKNEEDYIALPGEKGTGSFYREVDPTYKMFSFNEACYQDFHDTRARSESKRTPDGYNFSDSVNFAYMLDSNNPNITRLMIMTPNGQSDASQRPTYFCDLFCQIPTVEFKKLEELIRINPENAERFIEIAFAGLDNSNANRTPVKKVSIIDVDSYIPLDQMDDKNKRGSNLNFFMQRMKSKKLLDTSAITTYNFSRPLPEF